jgi:hypothetical protein
MTTTRRLVLVGTAATLAAAAVIMAVPVSGQGSGAPAPPIVVTAFGGEEPAYEVPRISGTGSRWTEAGQSPGTPGVSSAPPHG